MAAVSVERYSRYERDLSPELSDFFACFPDVELVQVEGTETELHDLTFIYEDSTEVHSLSSLRRGSPLRLALEALFIE